MKALYCFCVALLFAGRCMAQAEAELVKKVKARLDQVNDYKAQGRMKIDVSFIDAPPSKVTVYYRKPDKFKVVKEGGISLLPRGSVSTNLGSLLSKDYEVVPAKDAMLNGQTMKVVKLLPSDENSDVVLSILYIDEKNLVIRKATVTTRESGTYEIALDYGKYTSWGLPDRMVFSFNTKDYKLPKGVTFEYEKGGEKKEEPMKNKKGKVEINYTSYTINKGVDDKIFE